MSLCTWVSLYFAAPPSVCLPVSSQAVFKMQFSVFLSENPSLLYRQHHLIFWQSDQSAVRLLIPVYRIHSGHCLLCILTIDQSSPGASRAVSLSSFILQTWRNLQGDWVQLLCVVPNGVWNYSQMEARLGSSEDSTGLGTKEGFFIHMLGASNGVAEGTEPG